MGAEGAEAIQAARVEAALKMGGRVEFGRENGGCERRGDAG